MLWQNDGDCGIWKIWRFQCGSILSWEMRNWNLWIKKEPVDSCLAQALLRRQSTNLKINQIGTQSLSIICSTGISLKILIVWSLTLSGSLSFSTGAPWKLCHHHTKETQKGKVPKRRKKWADTHSNNWYGPSAEVWKIHVCSNPLLTDRLYW